MVLKIDNPEAKAPQPPLPRSEQPSNNTNGFDPPPSKKTKPNEGPSQEPKHATASAEKSPALICAGCKVSDKEAPGSLLLFDDPEEEEDKKDNKSDDLRSVFTSDLRYT